MADWDVVSTEQPQGDPWAVVMHEPHVEAGPPKDYDPVPTTGVPEGFHAVTGDDGGKTLRHNLGLEDIARMLSDIPGVGAAEHAVAGLTNLGSKAVSGIAGALSGGNPETVQQVQNALHIDAPQSNDPIQQGLDALSRGAQKVSAPIDRAVGNMSPGARTAIEGVEEAVPDIATLLGMRGAAPEAAATQNIARSPAEVAQAAGYTGLRTKADLASPGAQAITDRLIGADAGILPDQKPNVAALENARKVGPGKVYQQAEAAIAPNLTQDPELQAALGNLPQQVSQLPRSPDVDALQEVMLSQPAMTRDELFANIREARERAKSHWKSDDPDKAALGDAYAQLANSYEDFVGRRLNEAQAGVSLPDWLSARVQMAKNYQAQGALRGEHFDAQVYGRTAEKNPHLLTGNAAIVGHVANGLPASATTGMMELGPTAGGALAGEAVGQHMGIPGVGAVAGSIAAPLVRARIQQLLTRGNPGAASGAAGNPALSYFFNQGRMPAGWNRSLPSNVVDYPGPQGPEGLSLAPDAPPPSAPQGGIPFENVLEQGGTQARPIAGIQRGYRPAPQSPKGPNMRTPPGAPELTDELPQGPSPAQQAERSRLAANRLRALAGDLRLEGPGGATGDPTERALEALRRRVRGYAKGGSVKLKDIAVKVEVRPIQEFPRDERGLFIEPDKLTQKDIVQIEHNRKRASIKAYYADKHCGTQNTYDPNGHYPCGDCNQADGEHCLFVEDDSKPALPNGRYPPLVIDREKGSCGPFEIIDPHDPEQRGNRMPASIAGYGVRKGGGPKDVFGCWQCWKRKKSKHPVLLDRSDWCGEWGTTVEPRACCVVNGAPTEKRN